MREGAWGRGSRQIPGLQQPEHVWSRILSTSMLGAVKPQTGSASATGQNACRLQLALAKMEGVHWTLDLQPGKIQATQVENEAHTANLVQNE